MSDPSYPVFPVFSAISFVLVLTPLPWHLEAWNSGTCLYMIWTAVACLNQFINSIIWHGNALNWAPVWCDICAFYFSAFAIIVPYLFFSIAHNYRASCRYSRICSLHQSPTLQYFPPEECSGLSRRGTLSLRKSILSHLTQFR